MFYIFFKKCKICSYFHILDLYVTVLDICSKSNHMQQNSVMVFFFLFENKVDFDPFFKFYFTYNSFALKCPFDCWRKTIVSALKIGVCKQW